MSLFKISFIVLIIIILFGGLLFYQYSKTNYYKDQVTINKKVFMVQVVQKPLEMQKGLSGRDSMQETQGMLFVFGNKGDHPFWMKDMKFPLDIIFINDNKIVSISENVPEPKSPTEDLPLYRSTAASNKVLELKAGVAKKYNMKPGDTVTLPKK